MKDFCLAYHCDTSVEPQEWIILAKACVCPEEKIRQIEYEKSSKMLEKYDSLFNKSLERYDLLINIRKHLKVYFLF